MSDTTWIVSLDIGKLNFAFYIEEINLSELSKLKNIPKTKRYNADGTCTPNFQKVIDSVCMNGKTILYRNSDITAGCKKGTYFDPLLCHNMNQLLDEYKEYWDKCSMFVIEMQMNFGRKRNSMAVKLGQNCMSYFIFHYKDAKRVIEFPAYHKTQILGAEKIKTTTKTGKVSYKAIDKPKRKKWAVAEASRILAERDEIEVLLELSNARKRDDLADCLLMNCAYKYLHYVDKSI